MQLVLIDSTGNKHLVMEKVIMIMIDKLEEDDIDQAGLKLMLYGCMKDQININRIGNELKNRIS